MTPDPKTPLSQRRANARYLKSERGKATLKRYKQSAKGKATRIRADENRKNDPERKEKRREYSRRYHARKKAQQEAALPFLSKTTEIEEEKRECRRAYQREW